MCVLCGINELWQVGICASVCSSSGSPQQQDFKFYIEMKDFESSIFSLSRYVIQHVHSISEQEQLMTRFTQQSGGLETNYCNFNHCHSDSYDEHVMIWYKDNHVKLSIGRTNEFVVAYGASGLGIRLGLCPQDTAQPKGATLLSCIPGKGFWLLGHGTSSHQGWRSLSRCRRLSSTS